MLDKTIVLLVVDGKNLGFVVPGNATFVVDGKKISYTYYAVATDVKVQDGALKYVPKDVYDKIQSTDPESLVSNATPLDGVMIFLPPAAVLSTKLNDLFQHADDDTYDADILRKGATYTKYPVLRRRLFGRNK